MAILFQIRHGTGDAGRPSAPSSSTWAASWAGRAWWRFRSGSGGSPAGATPSRVRVAAATIAPDRGHRRLSALRGPVEANWAALVYPALCGAAAAELVRLRPAWSQGLLAFTVGLGMIFAVGFGLEVRNPSLIPPDSEVVKRFRGWPEYAAKARVAAGLACDAVGDPARLPPRRPLRLPLAATRRPAQLAFYAGWTRFGPASERPSQLDLWNQQPRPGEAVPHRGGHPRGETALPGARARPPPPPPRCAGSGRETARDPTSRPGRTGRARSPGA